jgi:hypothetical protein
MPDEEPDTTILTNLGKVWPSNNQRGKNMYLYWNRKDGENHGHVFFYDKTKRWYYNIKCNNNKGNDRKLHKIPKTETASSLKPEIKSHWKKECPEYIKKKTMKRVSSKKGTMKQTKTTKTKDKTKDKSD